MPNPSVTDLKRAKQIRQAEAIIKALHQQLKLLEEELELLRTRKQGPFDA